MVSKITKLTPHQEARLEEWSKRWIEIGLSTEPADFEKATDAALRGYALAHLKRPMVILRMSSPYGATLGGALAWAMLRELGNKEVESQVGSQVWSQVESQVWSQVESQVWSQVESQVESQVRSQVESQVWSQVESQVESQVWSQVESQVRSQVGSQVESQVGSQVWSANANSYHGAFWAGWTAYVSFFRDICGWTDSVLDRFEIDEALVKNCGWVWWHENVLAISDKPTVINRDVEGRLHSETGPSIAYRDGWQLHHWHGTSVPSEWIEDRATLTPTIALKQTNVEQRRAACEILGWGNILRSLKAKTIDKDNDPEIGELLEVKLPDLTGKARFLRVRCGTGREFAIGIPPHINKALDAQAWVIGLDPKDFTRPEVRA